jgi:protein SCO1/2
MKRAAAVALTAGLAMLCGCRARRVDFPDYGAIPEFKLTAQNGDAFNSASLRGKIWVADFMFTTCPGPCPRMTSQMHRIQEATWKMHDVKLVSFTVDPDRDTPQKLSLYAAEHHASPERWCFLTGSRQTLNHLGLDVFKLNRVDGALQHSTRFVLIDRASHIRGYYETSDADSIPKLIADIHDLASQPPDGHPYAPHG